MTAEEKTEPMDARVLAVSQEVAALTDAALEQIAGAATSEELEKLRVTYLGKQSRIMLLSKELGKVPAELRPAFGEAVNKVSLIPDTQEAIKKAVDGINEMLTKNPYKREAAKAARS